MSSGAAACGEGTAGAAGRRMVVRADGASKGNPGPSACGAVIEMDGEVIWDGGRRLGRTTNNVAEYEGLILGLETAASLGADAVEVKLDSELLVRQIEGRYKVKSAKLRPLFAKVSRLLSGFGEWSVSHVPRGENSAADRAANEALRDGG